MKKLIGLVVLLSLPLWANNDEKLGPVGPQGPQGLQGPVGLPGPKGNAGINGTNGLNGTSYTPTHFYGGLDLDLGLYDGKYVGVGLFNSVYAGNGDWANISGVRLSFRIGKSYEEKMMDKQIQELKREIKLLEESR